MSEMKTINVNYWNILVKNMQKKRINRNENLKHFSLNSLR